VLRTLFLLSFFLASATHAQQQLQGEALVKALRQGGYVIVMRHASSPREVPDKAAANAWEDRHILFAYVLLALIVLHIAAAAWHHFIRRDRVALRMVRGEVG